MNPTNDATRATAEVVPVPYPGQEPINEIDQAIAHLRSLRLALLADSLGLADYTTADAETMIGDVLDQLSPVRTFLAENDFGNVSTPFVECRRKWYAREGGDA